MRSSISHLKQINQYLISLARKRIPLSGGHGDKMALEENIHELIDVADTSCTFIYFPHIHTYKIISAGFYGQSSCGITERGKPNKPKQIWERTKKFFKARKKEIIIGAVVVAVFTALAIIADAPPPKKMKTNGSVEDKIPLSPTTLSPPYSPPLSKEALELESLRLEWQDPSKNMANWWKLGKKALRPSR